MSRIYQGIAYGGGVTDLGPVTLSPNEDRSMSYIQMENGLQVLLISDPDAEQAGAALDVKVGSLSDPSEFQGLAHAVEHCLFLGEGRLRLRPRPGRRCSGGMRDTSRR